MASASTPDSPAATRPPQGGRVRMSRYTAKELPQPHVVIALGLRMTNCAALRAGFAPQNCCFFFHPRFACGESAPSRGQGAHESLHSKGVAATARRHGIGVANDKLRTLDPIRKIDFGAGQVESAHGIDEQGHALLV